MFMLKIKSLITSILLISMTSFLGCSSAPTKEESSEKDKAPPTTIRDQDKKIIPQESESASLPLFFSLYEQTLKSYYLPFDQCSIMNKAFKQLALSFSEQTVDYPSLCQALTEQPFPNNLNKLLKLYQSQNGLTWTHIQKQESSLVKAFLEHLPGDNRLVQSAPSSDLIELGVITHPDGSGTILLVNEGSTADYYSLKPGDIIQSVNDTPVSSMGGNDALLEALTGKLYSKLKLSVKTPLRTRRIQMVLRATPETTIEASWLSSDKLYIKFHSISSHTHQEIREQLKQLVYSSETKPIELVIDFRGCKKGKTLDSIKIANLFLEKSVILAGKKKNSAKPIAVLAKQGIYLRGLIFSVLVDQDTQGPAEIIAAALQDADKADIIGSQTPGQEFLFSTFETSEPGVAFHLATAQLFRANGKTLQGGITPNVCVTPAENNLCKKENLQHLNAKHLIKLRP